MKKFFSIRFMQLTLLWALIFLFVMLKIVLILYNVYWEWISDNKASKEYLFYNMFPKFTQTKFIWREGKHLSIILLDLFFYARWLIISFTAYELIEKKHLQPKLMGLAYKFNLQNN